jgi:hypothetical protein
MKLFHIKMDLKIKETLNTSLLSSLPTNELKRTLLPLCYGDSVLAMLYQVCISAGTWVWKREERLV